ncbi:hypothetical protein [Hymenobacter lucidus]|uniref:Uncharacterized protein n=1 Tax=Hymenobacter lucidus TaxID=2880930 RepID=A0ABS8AMW0_9BACT|nr:hypothetical protein [Hymenobacter lucidus]MCB2407459.1 hypothetical protein [Hymenobacter lucidus]
MKFFLSLETSWQLGNRLDIVVAALNTDLKSLLLDKSYGNDIQELCIGVICVSPEFNTFFKVRRPRYQRAKRTYKGTYAPYTLEKYLTYDIALPYQEAVKASNGLLYQLLIERLLSSFELIALGQKKYPDFDTKTFTTEVSNLLQHIISQ